MTTNRRLASFFTLFFLICSLSGADEYNLDIDYSAINGLKAESVKSGDTITIQGKKFPVVKFLGEGSWTVVIEVEGGKVIKIPKENTSPFLNEIQHFKMGHDELRRKSHHQSNLPLVKVDAEKSLPPYFLILDKVPVQFTYEELISDFSMMQSKGLQSSPRFNLSAEEVETIQSKLQEFAKAFYEFSSIEDLHENNIGYDGEKWVLFDFGKEIRLYQEEKDLLGQEKTVLSPLYGVPEMVGLMSQIEVAELREKDRAMEIMSCSPTDSSPLFQSFIHQTLEDLREK